MIETRLNPAIRSARAHGPEIAISVAEVGGRSALVLSAHVGPATGFVARRLLEHNATLAIGALAIVDGAVELRHTILTNDEGEEDDEDDEDEEDDGVDGGVAASLVAEARRLRTLASCEAALALSALCDHFAS